MERRLAAILAADVVGYSRLMGVDEAGTHEALMAHRQAVIDPATAAHRGRIVKTTGDGVLAEFASVADAVECAVAIQKEMTARNAGVPEDRRIEFRIGINMGDVIVEDGDIYGDGVNLAARLERVAEPGGICVSRTVRNQVRDKLPYVFEFVGERTLKNISRPVQIYALYPPSRAKPSGGAASDLFEKPTVAVLPFENLSDDPDQEYFSDGITEDIIIGLSHWRWFPVIARNSSFAYKGQSVDVKRVGDELGARYVLEGSVRRAGTQMRITAQLIDVKSGHQIWAERYDRDLKDVFAVQDEITERIVASIEPELSRAEERRAFLKRPTDLSAWDYILRATRAQASGGHGYGTKEGNVEARELLRKAIALDPTSSRATALLAQCEWHDAIQGWADDFDAALANAVATARRAVALDDGDWLAHAVFGLTSLFGRGEAEIGVEELDRAVTLNPSSALARHGLGCALEFCGRPEDAIGYLQTVLKLDPRYRNATALWADLSLSNLLLGRHDDAVAYGKKAVSAQPDYVRGHQRLAAALAVAGLETEAKSVLDEVMRRQPNFSLAYVNATYPFRKAEHRALFIEGLRKAGLSE